MTERCARRATRARRARRARRATRALPTATRQTRRPGSISPSAIASCTQIAMLVAVAASGCDKSDRRPAAGSAAPPPVVIDAAAVNALVPPGLRDKLVFERRELAIERGAHRATYTLAAPAGWVQTSKLFAHLRPPGPTGQGPRFDVGSNCDGPCTPKPWEVIADRVNFAPRARGKVLKDDRTATRRTMIAEVETGGIKTTDVVVAWWADGDKSYHLCTAVLDDAFAGAAPAFDRACQAVATSGDD